VSRGESAPTHLAAADVDLENVNAGQTWEIYESSTWGQLGTNLLSRGSGRYLFHLNLKKADGSFYNYISTRSPGGVNVYGVTARTVKLLAAGTALLGLGLARRKTLL